MCLSVCVNVNVFVRVCERERERERVVRGGEKESFVHASVRACLKF